INLPFLAAGDHEVGRQYYAAGGVGQEERSARAKVGVGAVECGDIVGSEVVGHLEAPAVGVLSRGRAPIRHHLDERLVVVGIRWKALGVQCRRPAAAVAGLEVESAAVGLEGEPTASLPDAG